MYSDLPNYIIGFHGTSRKTAEAIIYDNEPFTISEDLIFRDLDCSVIHTAIELLEEERNGKPSHKIDSVRGAFWEGEELYPNAGFREFNHIQICIRNQECIKGCFWPKG